MTAIPGDLGDAQGDAETAADTGHACPYCPVSVRALYAVAYNAMLAHDMAAAGLGDRARADRKMAELRVTVNALEPLVAAHFRALGVTYSEQVR